MHVQTIKRRLIKSTILLLFCGFPACLTWVSHDFSAPDRENQIPPDSRICLIHSIFQAEGHEFSVTNLSESDRLLLAHSTNDMTYKKPFVQIVDFKPAEFAFMMLGASDFENVRQRLVEAGYNVKTIVYFDFEHSSVREVWLSMANTAQTINTTEDLYKIINSDLSLDEMVAMHIGSEPNKCRFQQSFYNGLFNIEEHYVGMKCERYATYHIMKAAIVDLYKLLDRSTAESMVGDLQSIENCDYSVRFLDNRITDRLRLSDNTFYWLLNRLSLSLIPDYFKHAEIYTIAIRNHNTQTETQHDFKYSRNSLEGLLFFFGLAFEGAGQELLNYERDFADRVPDDFQDAFQASVKSE